MSDILDKIRKLMAMADKNSGATEAEMETAMGMAQALMMKHAISEDALEVHEAGVDRHWVEDDDGHYYAFDIWAIPLAGAAGALNLVQMWRSRSGNDVKFSFVGRKDACVAADLMLRTLAREVERLYKLNLPRGLDKRDRAEYRRNFKFACATRIQQRAWEMERLLRTDDRKAKEMTGSTALVVVSTIKQRMDEINQWVAVQYPKGGKVAKPTKRRYGYGSADGLRAGDHAKIREELK